MGKFFFEIEEAPKDQVRIYGVVYELKDMTVKMREEFLESYESFDDMKTVEKAKFARSFMVSLGIPEDVVSGLKADRFDKLFAAIMDRQSEKK
jgi:intergrase/recombinase